MDGCKIEPLKSKLDLPQKRSVTSKGISNNKLETPSTPRTPKRYPSPNVTRNPTTAASPLPKRAQSAERRPSTPSAGRRPSTPSAERRPSTPSAERRPSTPSAERRPSTPTAERRPSTPTAERRPSTPSSSTTRSRPTTSSRDTSAETYAAARRGLSEGLWPTRRRNLSSSFQLESVPITKKDKINSSTASLDQLERKRTPLGQSENLHVTDNPISKMMEKQRWPGMAGGKAASINLSRSVDLTDKITRPGSALSFLRFRGVSPKRSPVSDVSNSISRSTENGAVSKLLAQSGPNATSRSVDLSDRPKKPFSRGNSPRRTSVSDSVNLKDKDKRPGSRGVSPVRTVSSAIVGAIARSKSVDGTDKTKRPVSSSSSRSRGVSPLRTPASEVTTNDSTNRPESRGSSARRAPTSEILSSAMSANLDLGDRMKRAIRVASPGRRSISEFPASAMSRSMDLDRSKRPASSSGRRKSISNKNSEADEKKGSSSGPNTPPQRSERSNSLTSASRTLSSPIPVFGQPSFPSSKRIIQSPSRGRPSTPSSTSSSSSGGSTRGTISRASLVNSVSETRKVKNKVTGNQMEELHQLKLLHSRFLQWQFINACIDDMHWNQKISSESMLYGMWSNISEMRDSVMMKRLHVQQLRQETNLEALLNEQSLSNTEPLNGRDSLKPHYRPVQTSEVPIDYLDSWAEVEREHNTLVAGAIEAIRATTLRLPVTGGAKADVLAMRNAVSSAVDIMQAMGSSVCFVLSKVENRNSLVEELAIVSTKERSMLDEGRELLATVAKLQVQESSLKTQLIQLRQDGLKMDQVGKMPN